MNVGVIELLVGGPQRGALDRLMARRITPQLVSVMPQAVAAWARRAGHTVRYAAYAGERRAEQLLPADLDVLFIACHSRASGLAYALAKLFRARGTVTVLGGPHASAFPLDSLRFFDMVVDRCDEALVRRILRDPRAVTGAISSHAPPRELPSLQERMPELHASVLLNGRAHAATVLPLVASLGCPYTCDFCIDWNKRYQLLPLELLAEDLRFASQQFPGVKLGFHDPNFAVPFDAVMSVLEATPGNPYLMQSSLSILNGDRLDRLARSGCRYTAPSLESWTDYSDKAGTGRRVGQAKYDAVVTQLEQIQSAIPGIQVNFVLGLDDETDDAIDLIERFAMRMPSVLSTATVAMPYGGTPLYSRLLAAGRVLRELPLLFYYAPYTATLPASGDIVAQYRRFARVFTQLGSLKIVTSRQRTSLPPMLKAIHNLRTLEERGRAAAVRRLAQRLQTDRTLRAFHEGRSGSLPESYQRAFDAVLGDYAALLPPNERIPRHAGIDSTPQFSAVG